MNCIRSLPARPAGLLALALVTLVAVVAADEIQAADSLAEAFTQGKATVGFRYRFEHVDQDPLDRNARASTLRGRLNFRTDDWNGFAAFGELDYIGNIGWDDYNEGAGNTPDRSEYPVVADPVGPDLNQAWLQWSDGSGTTLRGGRQRIIYDNARFVGNVGWRQNEQTYDGVWLQKKFGTGLDAQVAWVWQVNRIFGDDVPAGENDNTTWLANVGWDVADAGKLTGYYYDIDNDDVAGFSTRTWGLRFAGSRESGGLTFGYAAEYAHQTDGHNNPVDFSADYYRFDLSLGIGRITPYVGYESLGGDDGEAGASFRTPLATLHAFNGWADKFLATPGAGLDDVFGGVKGKIGDWAWNVVYHAFDAESGSGSYGSEVDASLARGFAGHYHVLFKAARFKGDDDPAYQDTTKFWIQISAHF
ncbi:alginate export family protein [Elongatibacter sediminis]|uniref:Alginate export family protein n=1 Tax=Elongatibacter sediminis TaxID=3119006 RepID=A0AAW9RNG5_9GAMM